MGRAKRSKKAKRLVKEKSAAPSNLRTTVRHSWRQHARKFLAFVVTAIGLVSAYVTIFGYFAPRISAHPVATLDPKDASSAVFAVTNESPVDIHNVAIGCRFLNFYMRYTQDGIVVTKRSGTEQRVAEIGAIHETVPFDAFHRTIAPRHSGTMKVPLAFPAGESENLDIEVVVHYRPGWYFSSRKEVFRFVSKSGADGQIHWLPYPEPGIDPYTPRSSTR
jgi:hypothetical protein